MTVGVAFLIVAVILFGLAFLSKRRFGVLGMALATGWIIAQYETSTISGYLADYGVSLGAIALPTAVSMTIILVPSLLLFFGGPTYPSKRARIIGSALYALTASLLCLGALGHSFVLMGIDKQIFDTVWVYKDQAIVGLLVLAVLDMFITHSLKAKKKD